MIGDRRVPIFQALGTATLVLAFVFGPLPAASSQVAGDAKARLIELAGPPGSGPGAAPTAGTGPTPGTEFKDCEVCPAMVVIPAGQFVMGSLPSQVGRLNSEGPPHMVTIARPFAVGKFAVTFDEWDACRADRECGPVRDQGWGRGRRPVINVSYEQALGYTEWLSEKTGKKYRLLTEAEWEYAARAGTETARFWGNSPDQACSFANVRDQSYGTKNNTKENLFNCDDGFPFTAPVGSFKPNAFGLYDMLGNVWQWVQDCWNASYDGAPTDGSVWSTGDCSVRVVRGGSWDYWPQHVRTTYRIRFVPFYRNYTIGFRIARTIP